SRGTHRGNHCNVRIDPRPAQQQNGNRRANARQEEIPQEIRSPPSDLQFPAEHPQDEHIEEPMENTAVEEQIRRCLPPPMVMPDALGGQGKQRGHGSWKELLKNEDDRAENDDDAYGAAKARSM